MRAAIAAAALVLALPVAVSAKDYAPREECGDVAGADSFRMALATAVANRDAAMLLPLFAEDVILDFGGGSGRELLRERLDDPDYGLWDALEALQLLGCAKGGEGGMVMPWYFDQDIGDHDPYGAYVVIGEQVPVFAAASGEQVTRTLDWEMVDLVGYHETAYETGNRREVVLEDGTRGFMQLDQLRALIDYRLGASRIDGNWQITAFIAGD